MVMRGSILSVLLLVAAGSSTACAQSKLDWTQLSLSTSRVDEFLKANPEHDGRGVVIAVMDTGVDPSIPGLTRTPDGQVKVIDVQDFSGQGDIELHRVRLDEQGLLINYDEEGSPIQYTLPDLPAGPVGEQRRFWFGFLDEAQFKNSEVSDLNDNGQTDDEFPICVTALTGDGDDQAVCFVDTNLDRSFADEKPLRNYRLQYDTFRLAREKPEREIEPLTFAVNLFLRQSKVVVVFDDGAHGTHVAGIAVGYQINNQAGFNGVAPGAQVMGLKISDNAIGAVSVTESMKRALEYGARYSREHGVPVVFNMSFGIESVIEGNSDIDKFADEFLQEHPGLIYCTSAGNEGPGLSTVGTPAAAARAISVAALLAPDTARDVQGFTLNAPVLTPFSSRGGELDKPDIAAPGWATSTVPRYVRSGDYWAGTSMASPYAAGLCALLISDAQASHPGKLVRGCDVRRALCLSARPVGDTTVLDVGYGVPDLPKAAEILDKLMSAAEGDPVLGYEISTPCPQGHKGRARAAYWRSTYFPTTKPQVFTVTPVFAPGIDTAARTAFTRQFELRSTVPWCRLPQEQCYLRSEQRARIFVEYDGDQLVEPGLHVGVVEALHEGEVAFRLVNTIVVPYRFTAEDDFARSFKNQVAQGWTSQRYFVAVPPGACAMRVTLAAPEGKESKARVACVCDPTGGRFRSGVPRLDTEAGNREADWTLTDELTPGVWEIVVVADRPDAEWPYELTVAFFGLHAEPDEITSWSDGSGELTVTNLFERPVMTAAEGRLEGFRKHKEDNFKGLKDELSYTISLDERFNAARVNLEFTPENYARMTDVGVRVEDSSGEALYASGFSNRKFTRTVGSPTPGAATTLKLIIRAGFAGSDDQRETPITVDIDYMLAGPLSIDVERDGQSNVDFIPGVPIELEFSLSDRLPDAPDGTRPVGYLRFDERATGDGVLNVQLDISE